MKREAIASFGNYGSKVNVYTVALSGEPVARVEWRELGQRRTQSFRGAKRDRETSAKAFAQATADRLRIGPAPLVKRYTIGELWNAYLTAMSPDRRPKTLKLATARWNVFTLHVDPMTYADLVQMETLDSWRKALLEVPTKRGVPMARNQVVRSLNSGTDFL